MDTKRIITLSVLAGAYKGGRRNLKITLTHSVVISETDDAMCGQANMVDEYGHSAEEHAAPPTCKRCLSRDPRFKA